MTKHILAAASLSAALLAGTAAWAGGGQPGHHHPAGAFGRPGDPKKPARVVNVVMKDGETMAFVPNRIEVRKGEQVRFKLRNDGALDHEMVLATLEMNLKHAEEMKKNPDMEHDDPNAKRVAPAKTSEILWRFDKAGAFDFSCLIPGHREAGMTGSVIVK
ncbi:copper tolerance protein [Alsobacter metallidurans]|uniref:Copper tolerance protein n=1 Tax=Alsobacter metallidurans TaxID=340221 RepID=A0A917I7H1_9HYPH|nr:cupredoxin family protein [Alsobacter metallidurans]GGH19436.1 copper tolerance protein [Alsobacter metallidurans]